MPWSRYPGQVCRSDPAKGDRRHTCSWWHTELVTGYRAAAHAQFLTAEEATSGYETELSEYWSTTKRITFREWLIGHRQEKAT